MASFERKRNKIEISLRQLYLQHHVCHLLLYRRDELTCNERSPPCQGAPCRWVLHVMMQTQQPDHGSWASVISLQLVEQAHTAAALWNFSTRVTPENSTPAHTAMGEMAKHDGKVSQQYSPLPGHSCYWSFPKEPLTSCHQVSHGPWFPLRHIHGSWMVGHAKQGLQIRLRQCGGVQGQRPMELIYCTLI